MKPTLQYALCCLGVDESDGLPTFQNVFRELPVPTLPFKFPSGTGFFLVFAFYGGEGTFTPALRLLEGDGAVTLEAEGEPFSIKDGYFLSVQFLDSVELFREGRHWLEISLDGERLAAVPLEVRVMPLSSAS